MRIWPILIITILCFVAGIGTALLAFHELLVAVPMQLEFGLADLFISMFALWLTVRGICLSRQAHRYRNKW